MRRQIASFLRSCAEWIEPSPKPENEPLRTERIVIRKANHTVVSQAPGDHGKYQTDIGDQIIGFLSEHETGPYVPDKIYWGYVGEVGSVRLSCVQFSPHRPLVLQSWEYFTNAATWIDGIGLVPLDYQPPTPKAGFTGTLDTGRGKAELKDGCIVAWH
jgi:hypothetical protein